MRESKLTLMLIGLLGGALLPAGCFITTESDRYTDTEGDSNPTAGGGGECAVGAPGCACTGSGACDIDLECVDMLNICVVPTGCDVGSPGCTCTEGGTCDMGLMCADVEPSPGICVSDNPCLDEFIGTETCQCTQGDGCDDGLDCISGLCVNLPEPATSSTTDATEGGSTSGGEASSSTNGAGESGEGGEGGADTSGGAAPTTGS